MTISTSYAKYGLCVVHYKAPVLVAQLVEAAQQWSVPPAHIVIADNSGDMPAGNSQFSVLRMGDNVGYGAAANAGIQELADRGLNYGLICTQEAVLSSDASRLLLESFEPNESKVAAAGPALVFRSRPDTVFSAGGSLTSRGVCKHIGRGVSAEHLKPISTPVHWIDGAVIMVDIKVFEKIGGFDSGYFLYVEEVDLCHRIRTQGCDVMIVKSAIAQQEPGNYTDYLRYRNSVYFTAKFPNELHAWPWLRIFVRDIMKMSVGRIKFSPVAALQGVRAAKRRQLGRP